MRALRLIVDARGVLGKDFDHRGKSDRDIRVATIAKVDAAFVADGKTDDAVATLFDAKVRQVADERVQLGNVNVASAVPSLVADGSSVNAAAQRMAQRHADAWKPRT
jgi:hypothetical protein